MHFNEVVNLRVLPAGKDGSNLVDVGSLYFIKMSGRVLLPLKKEGRCNTTRQHSGRGFIAVVIFYLCGIRHGRVGL